MTLGLQKKNTVKRPFPPPTSSPPFFPKRRSEKGFSVSGFTVGFAAGGFSIRAWCETLRGFSKAKRLKRLKMYENALSCCFMGLLSCFVGFLFDVRCARFRWLVKLFQDLFQNDRSIDSYFQLFEPIENLVVHFVSSRLASSRLAGDGSFASLIWVWCMIEALVPFS